MSMATNGSGTPPIVEESKETNETIIEEELRQMAAVRRDLAEVFKMYEKKAKARLGDLTRKAHQAYEDRETDQSTGTLADIQKTMEEKVNEMKQLKEKVEHCLKDLLEETGESKDLTSKVKTSESDEWKKMDKELENMLETAAKDDKGEEFDRLPETFRNCLLCLSIFPVGSEISKRVLIYWWIGEGFVSPIQQKSAEQEKSAEQVGEEYFKRLLDFEFIHPVYHKRSGSIVKCRIHPWIHWMLISKAKESKFFNFDDTGTPTSSPSKGHRACLITNLDDLKEQEPWPVVKKQEPSPDVKEPKPSPDVKEPKPSPDVGEPKPSPDVKEPKPSPDVQESNPYEKLVLLFNINVKYLNLEMEHFSRMKKIVVLQLGRWHASAKHHIEMDPQVLEKLCSLINLRYLSLRGISMIETIPKSIGKLRHLQVLDLRGCQNLTNLTDGITKLRRLTHLDVSECYMLESMPKGLSSLSELSMLKGFVISESNKTGHLSDLINLVNLKKLSIIIGSQAKKNITNQFGELEKMKSLSSLTVIWSDLPENTPGYKPHQVHSLKFPPNLEKLDLRFYPINDMPEWLGPKIPTQLKNLKKLYIRGGKLGEERDGKRGTLVLKHSGPKLDIKVLRLKFLQKLKLKWSEIELPSLDYFEHSQCEELEDPPLMDVDGVWTRVKETASDTAGVTGATSTTTTTTTDATTSQTHHDSTTTAPIATSTPTTTTSTSTSDSTISAPSAIIPDVAATVTTATSPSSPGPSSSPTLATTTTTATSPLATTTTGPALTPPTCPTTTTSVSPPTPKVIPSTPDLDDDNEHDEPAHDPSSSASTEAHLIDPHTTSPDGISASGVDSLVDEPTSGTPHVPSHIVPAATTASGPSSSTPTFVPPNKVDHEDDGHEDDLEDKSEHDITSSASTAAHAIDPNTASPDDVTVSALGAASMAAEPASGTPSVPGPTNAADVTRDSSLSSNPSSSSTSANQPSISTTPQVN